MNWKISKVDLEKIDAIVKRAAALYKRNTGKSAAGMGLSWDIIAVHLNGCPLDLDKLLGCSDFDLAHDVFGIRREINRKTGELKLFLPRCAR